MSAADVIREIDIAGDEIFREIVKDAENAMKGFAPHPTGATKGLGSMSKGKLRGEITSEIVSQTEAWVGVKGHSYAQYANSGRGAITKPYRMTFVGSDGKKHSTRHVDAMEGWHFVEKTAAYIGGKYG